MDTKDIIIDDEDRHLIEGHKWRIYKSRSKEYIQTSTGKYLHRMVTNAPVGFDVDHINGNTLDNRRNNLRICTRSQNLCNRPAPRNNLTGYKGVYWDKNKNRFRAVITKNKKIYRLGRFKTATEAALAYNLAAKKLHGEYAYINTLL